MDPVTISAIISGVAKVGIGVHDANKRRKFDEALASMNAVKQRELAEKIAKEQSQAAKYQILADAVRRQEMQQQLPLYIGGAFLLAGLIATIFYFRK